MGYSSGRARDPQRIFNWKRDTVSLGTAAGWSGLLYTNLTYSYGFWFDVGTRTAYLRLPPNARRANGTVTSNPNDLYITIGGDDGMANIAVNGPGVRVSGLELRSAESGIAF